MQNKLLILSLKNCVNINLMFKNNKYQFSPLIIIESDIKIIFLYIKYEIEKLKLTIFLLLND